MTTVQPHPLSPAWDAIESDHLGNLPHPRQSEATP